MNRAVDVSVVMSVYNGADHLEDTVRSILAQEDVELELVVVDDGSTDRTAEILSRYEASDPRVRVLTREANRGVTEALILGCAEARGELIARQDVGDHSIESRLRIQKQYMDEDSGLILISCWTEYCGPEWEHLYTNSSHGRSSVPVSILNIEEPNSLIDGPTHHGSVMFRRVAYESVGGYRRQFYYGQDWDLWYRLGQKGLYQTVEGVLYRARIFPESLSSQSRRRQIQIGRLSEECMRNRLRGTSEDELLEKIERIRPNGEHSGRRGDARANYFIGELLRRNGDRAARKYLWRSVKSQPLFARAWLRLLQEQLTRW